MSYNIICSLIQLHNIQLTIPFSNLTFPAFYEHAHAHLSLRLSRMLMNYITLQDTTFNYITLHCILCYYIGFATYNNIFVPLPRYVTLMSAVRAYKYSIPIYIIRFNHWHIYQRTQGTYLKTSDRSNRSNMHHRITAAISKICRWLS